MPATIELPKVRFHDLRHTHAFALIAGGLDVVAISRRLGHASPVVTLSVYAHLFQEVGRRRGSGDKGCDENGRRTITGLRCQPGAKCREMARPAFA